MDRKQLAQRSNVDQANSTSATPKSTDIKKKYCLSGKENKE